MAGSGGHKAVLAISGDNESAVIKYRSEQDMASICEYTLVLERANGNLKTQISNWIKIQLDDLLILCKMDLNVIRNIWKLRQNVSLFKP